MTRAVVPNGMVPGRAGYRYAYRGPTLCDLSANSKAGIPPAAWVLVVVTPALDSDGGQLVVTADSAGRLLHPLWTFTRPTIERGKRMKNYPSWQPTGIDVDDPVLVETDPGEFWVGSDTYLSFVGGTPGDEYDVSVTFRTTRDEVDAERTIDVYEPAFEYTLTSAFKENGFVNFPQAPDYHSGFNIAFGAAQVVVGGVGTVPLGNSPLKKPLPLSLGRFQVQTGVYVTTGAL